jgi:peptide chain release factor 2
VIARNSSDSTPNGWPNCGGIFDLDAKRDTLRQLEERMSAPGFWDNQQSAQAVVQQVKAVKGWVEPFDAQARRHTSFASAFVYPVVDNEINIEVRDEDIKMDVFRASGAGGQHVNKTSSAVRLTHIPTGIVVASQQERSQHKNKGTAMKMLKNRLNQLEAEKQAKKKAELDATKSDVSFGSQIRSYVFQPYTMVNDHRTELKIPDVQRVMDGDLDPFIEAFLKRFGSKAA